MPWIDFDAVKAQIPISEVLRLIGWTPNRKEPAALRGKCPLHPSGNPKPSRSFAVNLEANWFFCANAKCGQKGDQIRLYALHQGLSMYEAARKLCSLLGLKIPLQKRNGDEARL